jgi:hypothetical protein
MATMAAPCHRAEDSLKRRYKILNIEVSSPPFRDHGLSRYPAREIPELAEMVCRARPAIYMNSGVHLLQ